MSSVPSPSNRSASARRLLWLLIAITLAGAALRLWRLDQLPPGLYFDEAYNGLDARAVAAGERFPLYFSGNYGREPLYIYLQAALVALLGPTPYALRLTSALVGIITLPLTYFAAREILSAPGEEESVWPALIAAAGIAFSFWHLSLSRLAFRVILLPALSLPAMAYFWRAWRSGARRAYLMAGVWFGLALYSYLAARLLPFVVLLFLLIELIRDLITRPKDWRSLWRSRLIGLGWLAAAGLIVVLPLLTAFARDPSLITARTGDVSIFTAHQADMPGTPGARFLANLSAVTRSFYTTGDLNLRHNLPGRPVQDWLLAALFTAGWLTALVRLRAARMRLLLLWFAIMALPALLSTNAPHFLRMAGMLPPLALFYGVGAQSLARLAAPRLQPARVGFALLLLLPAVSGVTTGRDYFLRWAGQADLGESFDLEQQLAAQIIPQLAAEGGSAITTNYLFPSPQMRFAAGELAMADAGPVAEPVTLVTEENPDPFQPLYLLAATSSGLRAVWIQAGPDDRLDATALSAESPRAFNWPGGDTDWPGLLVGAPAEVANPAPAGPRYPLDVTFANGLQLLGYDMTPDGYSARTADATFQLATYWRIAPNGAPPAAGTYDLFAHLRLADGRLIQENGNLSRNYPVVLWEPGQIIADRREFTLPGDAAPGKARFEIGLFNPAVADGAERISILDGTGAAAADRVTLGAVAVDMLPEQAPVDDLTPAPARFAEHILLAGWSVRRDPVDETGVQVDLAWQALDRVTSDYTAFVHLLDETGAIVAQFDQPPGGADNPTTNWLPGERVRTTFPLTGVPTGSDYRLRIGLYEPVSGRQLPVVGDGADATFVVIPLEAQP
ncbi:MAG: glycosyltransferase family 39 protein [Caldilineaceae bacterium]|nr:glycosyltransferase family 39 protein [Caldilineaceae bacterium]